MSLTVGVFTPEGIVLAADSRQSYTNVQGVSRIGSDSATKVFQVGDYVGVTVAGPAFLVDPKQPKLGPRSIGTFITDVLDQLTPKETVESIMNKLRAHLEEVYDYKAQLKQLEEQLTKQIEAQGGKEVKRKTAKYGEAIAVDYIDKDNKHIQGLAQIKPITLIVAGYDKKGDANELSGYTVYIPGPTKKVRQHGESNQYGASWTGQTDVIGRIVKGFDPRIEALDFIQGAFKNSGQEKINQQLNGLEYRINWGAMNLFDAVDFARLMIETTTAIQRYSDGIGIMPGDMPGVGGPIDIAIIKPQEGFKWHQKKVLSLS
jgi:hypothetical protein